MENKEIYIDGVDVSRCKCYNPNIKMDCLMFPLQPDACKNNPNCHYKLYKRKEQEYEELRQYHNKYCEENAKKLEEWLEKYNQISRDFCNGKYCNKENCRLLQDKEQEYDRLKRDYFKQNKMLQEQKKELDLLKAENERLEAHSATLDTIIETGKVQYKALKQTLIEIKEIAKKFTDDYGHKVSNAKIILQKISETEDGQ